MAYKPPKQQIDNNDVKNIPSSEAIYEALKYKIDQPTISGTAGQLLQLDGYTTDPDGILNEPITSWVNPPAGGANTSLSNLSSVAINTALLGTLGTVSAPAYSFTGDSNTGIWSSAADTLNFSTNSLERMRISSSGNIGIGTATPTEKLEVAGAVLATEYRVPNYRLDPHTHDEGTETTDFTINWSNGAVHTVTLNAAGPLVITMSNPVNGGAYALRIIQGATPGTVTWPANVKWPGGTPPTLSTNTGDIDIVNLLYFDDGGGNTFYYATSALAFA